MRQKSALALRMARKSGTAIAGPAGPSMPPLQCFHVIYMPCMNGIDRIYTSNIGSCMSTVHHIKYKVMHGDLACVSMSIVAV